VAPDHTEPMSPAATAADPQEDDPMTIPDDQIGLF
jgi:hypothetical protein